MNKTKNIVTKESGAATLVRAKFGPGMLLQHEDMEQLSTYSRELSRLLFRSFFGCGVVCGLVVTPDYDECKRVRVNVDAGLALDCSGDPIHVPKNVSFVLDKDCCLELPRHLWVVLCGTTKQCAPRTSMCADDDDTTTSVCTRELAMFEIRVLSEPPSCACGCEVPKEHSGSKVVNDMCKCVDPSLPCYKDHYDGMCGCNGGGSDCGCDCVLLARLDKAMEGDTWTADHRVRRFIRPVLMRDPQVEKEFEGLNQTTPSPTPIAVPAPTETNKGSQPKRRATTK